MFKLILEILLEWTKKNICPFEAFVPFMILKESRIKNVKFLSYREESLIVWKQHSDGLAASSRHVLSLWKRGNSKRNVAYRIELFHAIVVVFSSGRIEAIDGSEGEWWWGGEGENEK